MPSRRTGRPDGLSRLNLLLLAVFLGAACLANSLFAEGTTHIVTNLADSGSGSLREQIATAAPGDTISFAVRGTIALTNGELLIGKNLRIAGPGATNLAVSAQSQSRVLEIASNAAVEISGLTICNGHATDGVAGTSNSPAGGDGEDGGGIYNVGLLRIEQCVISNCAAGNGGAGYQPIPFEMPDGTNWLGGVGGDGGAIYNARMLSLTGCSLISNSSGAGGDGGGAWENGGSGNSGGGGGAIYNVGVMTLRTSVFEHNAAGHGGAAYSFPDYFVEAAGGQHGGAGGDGGAVCDAGPSTTPVFNCQFNFNVSGAGGIAESKSGLSGADFGGLGGAGGSGGAIWVEGVSSMNNCAFLSNQTGAGGAGGFGWKNGGAGGVGGSGGAIYSLGQLSLVDCSCASNQLGRGGDGGWGSGLGGSGGVGGSGGAICAFNEMSLKRCSCASNHAGPGGDGGSSGGSSGSGANGGSGGAIYAASTLQLSECTFSDNWTGSGGQGPSTPSYNTSSRYLIPGGGGAGGSGGGIFCQLDLRASNCSFSRNQAGNGGPPGSAGYNASFSGQPSTSGSDGGQGGGIFCAGPLLLHGCTLSANVGGNGTPADRPNPSFAHVNISAMALNSDHPLSSSPHPNIIITTRSGGPGGAGGTGGIYAENKLEMTLCTASGNIGGAGGSGGASADYMTYRAGGGGGSGGAGAIHCASSNAFALVACTIADNHGGGGGRGGSGEPVPDSSGRTGQGPGGGGGAGGIFIANTNSAASSSINTIVASNFGGAGGAGGPYFGSSGGPGAPDAQGSFTSLGHNLIGRTDGSSGFTNGVNGDLAGSTNTPLDPVLGPLADNGGPTYTMALLHGSPALDAGDDALLRPPYVLINDQRGFPRKSGSHVDIGAFESQYGSGPHSRMAAPTLSGAYLPNESKMASEASAESSLLKAPGYQLTFSDSTPGATFTVLGTANLSLPLDNWSVLGQAIQTAPGLFQFTDPQATQNPQRFYRVSSP